MLVLSYFEGHLDWNWNWNWNPNVFDKNEFVGGSNILTLAKNWKSKP